MGTKQYDNYADLITFTRASKGTSLRPISYGPELVTNGTFDSDVSGWTAGPSISLTAVDGDLRITRGVSLNQVNYTAVTTVSGKVYQVSWQYKGRSAGSTHYTDFRVGSTISGVDYYRATDSSSSEFSQEVRTGVFAAAGTTTYVSVLLRDGVSGDYIEVDNISVKEVLFDQPDGTLTLFNHPDDIPRIDYDANGNRKGLLIEEQRTNLIAYSEDLENPEWGKAGVTVVENVLTATTGAQNFIHDSVTFAGSTQYTLWADVEDIDAGYAYVNSFDGTDNFGAMFNLTTGSFVGYRSGTSPQGYHIVNVGPNRYLIGVTFTVAASPSFSVYNVICGLSTNGSLSFSSSTNGEQIIVHRIQLEEGSFPTSYIPTSGTQVTRSADVASIPVSAFGYNQKAGTVVVEYDRLYTGTNGQYVAAISDGTTGNMIRVYGISIGLDGFYSSSDGVQGLVSQTTGPMTTAFKTMAGAFKLNNAAVIDSVGDTIYTDSSFEMPLNVSVVSIGSNNGATQLNGHIKSIQYYPRRLTNTQLQELTS